MKRSLGLPVTVLFLFASFFTNHQSAAGIAQPLSIGKLKDEVAATAKPYPTMGFVVADVPRTSKDANASARKALFVFAPGSPIHVGASPGCIVAGDVNQDGKPDLLVASSQGISVLLGKGDGRFESSRGGPIRVPKWPSEMVLRDFNNDGKLDIAFAHHDSYEVILLSGDGRGGFAMGTNSTVVMKRGQHPHTHGLMAGDLNGDGKPDLVTVNSTDSDISIALGDGKGGFTAASASFPIGASPYPGALADLNGDGHLDIVGTSTGRHSREEEASTRALTILFGDGRGSFQSKRVPLRTVLPWFVAVADLNGDHQPDLVVTHAERRELTVLIGNGKGDFMETAASPINLGHSAWHMAVVDVNADGKPDVITAAGNSLRVLLGDGRGGFVPGPGSPFDSGKGTWQIAVADWNGDGKADVAATNVESDTVTVWLGQ